MAGIASQPSPVIPGIQFLRALAATAVVAFHVQFDITNNLSMPGSLPAGLTLAPPASTCSS